MDTDEIEKYIHAMDHSEEMKNELIWYESDYYINSITNLSQYILPGYFLTTLIGELHGYEWKCPDPSGSIADYVKDRINNNKNIKIMLEVASNFKDLNLNLSRSGSQAVRDIYTSFVDQKNVLDDKFLPYDNRFRLLGYRNHEYLYQATDDFRQIKREQIKDIYIESLHYHLRHRKFDVYEEQLIHPSFRRRLDSLLGGIDTSMKNLARLLFQEKKSQKTEKRLAIIKANKDGKQRKRRVPPPDYEVSKVYIRDQLRRVWQEICDFFVIKELYTNNGITEYIFVGGQAHYLYIKKELSETLKTLSVLQGSHWDCVNLYGSYKFN